MKSREATEMAAEIYTINTISGMKTETRLQSASETHPAENHRASRNRKPEIEKARKAAAIQATPLK